MKSSLEAFLELMRQTEMVGRDFSVCTAHPEIESFKQASEINRSCLLNLHQIKLINMVGIQNEASVLLNLSMG